MMAEKKPKKTKNTKEEIEAALDYACGRGAKPVIGGADENESKCVVEESKSLDEKVIDKAVKENKTFDVKCMADPEEEPEVFPENDPVAMSTEDFGRKCFNLDITAAQANYQSTKHKDQTIEDYLRGINKKIYDEVRNGGYSTNVTFRNSPNDWVNVQHIVDWYKARGFQVANYEPTHPQYGKNAGTIEYNFQISWACARD